VIYFDAAYVAKCYLNEPGADRVREVAYSADGLASCELARLEFASILKRHVREHHLTRREMTAILKDFEEDEQSGVWHWFSVNSELLEKARKAVLDLPSTVFVRSADALHLACAEEQGFREVYTNDRHMLTAARYFHLTGVNVMDSSPSS
jgi:predicted nucleic acid-binding protein